jgi:PAS domain S-box-containing protein
MLAENSSDVYFSVRLPGARYEYISPSVEALCGFSPEAFYRDAGTFLRCVAPAWREQMAVWLAEIDRGQVAEAYEFQVIGPDGSLRWVRQRQIRGATPDGAAWLLQGVATDITELRQAQTELRESKEHCTPAHRTVADQVALSVNLDAGRQNSEPQHGADARYTPQVFYDDPDSRGASCRRIGCDKARRWFRRSDPEPSALL